MRTKCRSMATFHRPIHSHWSLPLSFESEKFIILFCAHLYFQYSAHPRLHPQSLILYFPKKLRIFTYFPKGPIFLCSFLTVLHNGNSLFIYSIYCSLFYIKHTLRRFEDFISLLIIYAVNHIKYENAPSGLLKKWFMDSTVLYSVKSHSASSCKSNINFVK